MRRTMNGMQGKRRQRWAGAIGAVVVASLAVVLAVVVAPAPPAAAQERPRTILDMLFGGNGASRRPPRGVTPRYRITNPEPSEPAPRRSQRKPRSRNAAPKPAAAAAPPPPPPPETTKAEDAETILVVGDFLAASLAKGLKDAYADNPMVDVTAAASGSSGLVRQDHYDWSKQLGPLIEANEPAVVVVMVGSNDRQPFSGKTGTLSLRSPEWDAEYARRVGEIAEIVQKRQIPLVWVGAPPFKFDRMSEDMVYLNDIYRQAAQKVSGEYVDVWEGFVDENDGFVYSGPGVDGQTVQLRNSDGITMTDAGDDKLAFFAKKAIDRFISTNAPLLSGVPAGIELPPIANAATAVRAPPVSLSDPSLDGGDALLGGGSMAVGLTLETSPRDKLVLIGRGTGNIDGRADDFAWNDKAAAVAADDKPVAYRGSIDLDKVRQEQGIKPPGEMPSILDAIIDDWAQSGREASEAN